MSEWRTEWTNEQANERMKWHEMERNGTEWNEMKWHKWMGDINEWMYDFNELNDLNAWMNGWHDMTWHEMTWHEMKWTKKGRKEWNKWMK
jgi:hypothetical protein